MGLNGMPDGFQWNGELQLRARERSSSIESRYEVRAAAEAGLLLRNGLDSVEALLKEPFASLPVFLLNSLRDENFRGGNLAHPIGGNLANVVRTSCLLRLNQGVGHHSLSSSNEYHGLVRQIVLLSMLSPQIVISTLCEWAERQTLFEKRQIACELVGSLGNAAAYRSADNEAGFLLQWYREAFISCCSSGSTERASRLCQSLTQFLKSSSNASITTTSIGACLQFLVRPLLSMGHVAVAHDVIQGITQIAPENSVLAIPQNDEILSIVQTLCQSDSFENRKVGKIDIVNYASEAIDMLLGELSSNFATKLLSKLDGEIALPVLWRVYHFCSDREAYMAKCRKQLTSALEEAFTPSAEISLQACEKVIVLSVAFASFREKLFDDYDEASTVCTEGQVMSEVADIKLVWIVALARQLPLLATKELEFFLRDAMPKVMRRAFIRAPSCPLQPGSCTRWCGATTTFHLGFRAVSLLLRDSSSQVSVSGDDFAILRITRVLCSCAVSVLVHSSEEVVPRGVFLSILADIFAMVQMACGGEQKYPATHPGFRDVLMVTVLEVCRAMLRVVRVVRDELALERVSQLFERSKRGNVLARHLAKSAAGVFEMAEENPYDMDV